MMEESSRQPKVISDTELLQRIKEEFYRQINEHEIKMKVGDLVKILDIQRNLASDPDAKEKFWEMIEKIRQEELKDE